MRLFSIILTIMAMAHSSFGQSGDTIRTASGLKVLIKQPGKGKMPVPGKKLMVHYMGKFSDGEVFDSTQESDPIVFELGKAEVIKGWEEGFLLLSKGGKAVFVVPPELGYGADGLRMPDNHNSYKIPPDAQLIYEVELVDFR